MGVSGYGLFEKEEARRGSCLLEWNSIPALVLIFRSWPRDVFCAQVNKQVGCEAGFIRLQIQVLAETAFAFKAMEPPLGLTPSPGAMPSLLWIPLHSSAHPVSSNSSRPLFSLLRIFVSMLKSGEHKPLNL